MKVRNPIEPMTIAPRKSSWPRTLAICAIASLPWIWFLHDECVRYERLLAEKQASTMRVESLTLRYANGVKTVVEIKERQE